MSFDPSDMGALVLDSSAFDRDISFTLLRAMGFRRVHTAAAPPEAWELLSANNPDIVLTDWLEGADPLEFVRRVRTSEGAPNRAVSIFMLTSRCSAADVDSARKAGVDGYLRKPISALALRDRVRSVMANPQPFVVSATYAGPCRRRRVHVDYAGPPRRLEDKLAAQGGNGEEAGEVRAQLARARVAALENSARDFKSGDAAAARRVLRAAHDLLAAAEQIEDAALAFGTKEMMRYLQAQGANVQLDPEVVRTHIAALHQLAHLPPGLGEERNQVAQSLGRMVDKKLKPAA